MDCTTHLTGSLADEVLQGGVRRGLSAEDLFDAADHSGGYERTCVGVQATVDCNRRQNFLPTLLPEGVAESQRVVRRVPVEVELAAAETYRVFTGEASEGRLVVPSPVLVYPGYYRHPSSELEGKCAIRLICRQPKRLVEEKSELLPV